MPVLPDVASTIVAPGFSSPRRSASSTIASARRSFTEPPGFAASSFTYIVTFAGASRAMRTTGVRPMVWVTSS